MDAHYAIACDLPGRETAQLLTRDRICLRHLQTCTQIGDRTDCRLLYSRILVSDTAHMTFGIQQKQMTRNAAQSAMRHLRHAAPLYRENTYLFLRSGMPSNFGWAIMAGYSPEEFLPAVYEYLE